MVKPPPDNLGSRQRALNARVNETAAKKTDFDTIKNELEATEVDKLYKIDLAAKYKHINYILEVIRSGDSLYTTRALKKCQWLYTDEYSHILNPTYLMNNVFPVTSLKMKRKILKSAAANVTNPKGAAVFYEYCMQEKMRNSAFTALLYTTDEFKLEQLRNNKEPAFEALQDKDIIYFRFLVGKSFELLDALLTFISINWKISTTARQFKNFYSESEEKYLDIAEKYVSTYFGFQTDKFDPKLSDSIMKRHKHRVLAKPQFYVNTVDTDVLVRNSSIDEAKIYAKVLLPDNVYRFWELYHYTIYKSVFRIIPHEKTYEFFKTYFDENYPGAVFDMHPGFYNQKYYEFMTIEQREEWAFRHLRSEKQILGVGNDYLWYKFVRFNTAFEEIKRYISITKKPDTRNDMIEVLVESARNDRELETLFIYYHKRHMNELRKYKESFLNKVLSDHNAFEFDEACWTAFYTLLLSMEITNSKEGKDNYDTTKNKENYKTVALLYHILHKKEMPQILIAYLLDHFRVKLVQDHLYRINDESKRRWLHEYLFGFYMTQISDSKHKTIGLNHFRSEVEPKWTIYFRNMQTSMELFNENGEENHVGQFSGRRKRRFNCTHHICGRSLLRDLKTDKELLINNLSRIQGEMEVSHRKINVFLDKIRVYFPNDITQTYIEMFQTVILNDELVNGNCHRLPRHIEYAVATGVNAIIRLADKEVKVDFMKQYYPVAQKAAQKKPDIQFLRIQKAICRFACSSRPPVPLSSIAVFMKGYTAKSCLNTFNTYLAILPLPMCKQFVLLVIDAPVSIQKHAIRLAFQCFSCDDLKETILNIWKNSKNVTLRNLIYTAFYNKVVDTKKEHFYDILKILTLELNQDDESAVFDITVSTKTKLPNAFLGDYIEVVWESVEKFKDIEPNLSRKKNVVKYMRDHIQLMREEFVTTVVHKHVNHMLLEGQVVYLNNDKVALCKQKWLLTEHFIMYLSNNPPAKYVDLAQLVVRQNVQNWNKVACGKHMYQKCCKHFIDNLENISLQEKYGRFENAVPIFEAILEIVDTDLRYYESYLLKWELQLILLTANVIKQNRSKDKENNKDVIIHSIDEFATGVGELVSSYIQNKKYFISFSYEIEDLITNYVQQILKLLNKEMGKEDNSKVKHPDANDCLIRLAAVLVKFECVETYMLAVQLIPKDYQNYSSDVIFNCLIKKLQQFPNEEVQLLLYDKMQEYSTEK